MAVRTGFGVLICFVTILAAGCGGDESPKPKPAPLVVGAGTVATEPKASDSTYRTEHFSFTLPAGWADEPSSSAAAYGQPASIASIAPAGAKRSSLVYVIAYDTRGQPAESADGPRAWFDWYAETNEAEITQAANEVGFAGGQGWRGALHWTDDVGSPVAVTIVRAARGEVLYLIQCAAELADRAAIASGCETIVRSFREAG